MQPVPDVVRHDEIALDQDRVARADVFQVRLSEHHLLN